MVLGPAASNENSGIENSKSNAYRSDLSVNESMDLEDFGKRLGEEYNLKNVGGAAFSAEELVASIRPNSFAEQDPLSRHRSHDYKGA
jgi:hypothetical protein